ncbi:MAG: phosphoribosylanthranilate isomerase, partial [Chitinispirillaceae bacterium]|nr:phosphoribosylanthranilate isomerase [Chitinispirillaceae bacterium]
MATIRIKVCGITSEQDALVAARLGADAVGFIFFEKSPRFIYPEDAAKIIKKLPPFISRVGVFVNTNIETIIYIAQMIGLDTICLLYTS